MRLREFPRNRQDVGFTLERFEAIPSILAFGLLD
jgi:hypothetical protein